MKIGYCPWCGRATSVFAVFPQSLDIEWTRCRDFMCKGSRKDVISDSNGFIKHPKDIRGHYIHSKPKLGKGEGNG